MIFLVVTHQLPYDALVTAVASFDPISFSDEDDTVTEVVDGVEVTLLRDWSKPPDKTRCKCQATGAICTCGKGALPEGYIHWDKVNAINR